jgi:hypothetical protein
VAKPAPRKKQYNTMYTPGRLQKFLEALSVYGNATRAAAENGLAMSHLKRLREKKGEFAAQWTEALERAADGLEDEARRRAVEGVEEPVYHQGVQVGAVRKYSDTLLIFLLKGCRPDVYRERYQVNHAGKVAHDHEHHHQHEPVSATAAWIDGLLGTGEDRPTTDALPH